MRLSVLQAGWSAKSLNTLLASTFVSLFIIFHLHYMSETRGFNLIPSVFSRPDESSTQSAQTVELVISSLKQQNTSWYSDYFPHWKRNIYVVDDPAAALTVPQNKGHEAMVYLTYIIDRYDNLPGNTFFLHAERFQWHNDNPDYDGLLLLQNFQVPYLQTQGYVNLRCVWALGCPAAYHPLKDDSSRQQQTSDATALIYLQTFQELLPEYQVPTNVAVSCCAQFAVTRDTIRKRPREDYIRYRKWLIETPLRDEDSGRFFEHSWHIIFGKDPVFCPSAKDCYCKAGMEKHGLLMVHYDDRDNPYDASSTQTLTQALTSDTTQSKTYEERGRASHVPYTPPDFHAEITQAQCIPPQRAAQHTMRQQMTTSSDPTPAELADYTPPNPEMSSTIDSSEDDSIPY